MAPPKILIADNDPLFVNSCAEFLEMSGYRVLRAYNLEDARLLLGEGAAHLAILDLRMRDDKDRMDLSGLALAKKSDPAIPKIILTSFQEWEHVREALAPTADDVTPAVSFVAKQEGLEVLLSHTRRAFEKFVYFNQSLEIEWSERDCVSLLKLVEPRLELEGLQERAEEFEDLFRLLFRRKERLRIGRLLWQDEGRLALACYSFEKGKKAEALIVVCGRKRVLTEEARLFAEYAPGGGTATGLRETKVTSHFAANTYAVPGARLEELRPLSEVYLTGTERSFKETLDHLFAVTLLSWSEGRIVPSEKATLERTYRQRLGSLRKHSLLALLTEHAEALAESLPAFGIEIALGTGSMQFTFGGHTYQYRAPEAILGEHFAKLPRIQMLHTPGQLSGATVLTDTQHRTWVTDFEAAGLAPRSWAYAEVEASVRFDLIPDAPLAWIHGMERQLVFGGFLKLQPSDVEAPLRKPLKTIQTIRQMSHRAAGKDLRSYHLAIILQAARRLAAIRPSPNLLGPELVRAVHLLLAVAMICAGIRQGTGEPETESTGTGIQLNKASHEVWVDGRKFTIRGRGYDLLKYFFEHQNRLCTRRELVEQVFVETFDETDVSQIRRLNTAIHRLRKQIELDPESPRYLLTEQRGGYRFIPVSGSELLRENFP